MRRSTENSAVRAVAVAAVVGFGTILAACSDIYYDRRETVLFGANDAVAANIAVQTIDPWPPGSANRNAPGNGERVAAAIRRYRTGRVYQPMGNGTSSSYQQQQQQQVQQQTPQSQGSGSVSDSNGIPVK